MKDKIIETLFGVGSFLVAAIIYYIVAIWQPTFIKILIEYAVCVLLIAAFTCYLLGKKKINEN